MTAPVVVRGRRLQPVASPCDECLEQFQQAGPGEEFAAGYLLLPRGFVDSWDGDALCADHREDLEMGISPRLMVWRSLGLVGAA